MGLGDTEVSMHSCGVWGNERGGVGDEGRKILGEKEGLV